MKKIFIITLCLWLIYDVNCKSTKSSSSLYSNQESKKALLTEAVNKISSELKAQQNAIRDQNMRIGKENLENEKHIQKLNSEISMLSLMDARFLEKSTLEINLESKHRKLSLLPRFQEVPSSENNESSPSYVVSSDDSNSDIDNLLKDQVNDMVIDAKIKESLDKGN